MGKVGKVIGVERVKKSTVVRRVSAVALYLCPALVQNASDSEEYSRHQGRRVIDKNLYKFGDFNQDFNPSIVSNRQRIRWNR